MTDVRRLKYAFRLTHIDNIPHIVKYGLTHVASHNANPDYRTIGNSQIISRRQNKMIAAIERTVGSYIPLYLGNRSEMLYVVQHNYIESLRIPAGELIHCVVSLDELNRNHIKCLFTDGNAASSITTFYDGSKLSLIDQYIRYEDVYARNWNDKSDTDLRRRKQAELLLSDDLPSNFIAGYVVYDTNAKEKLLSYGIPNGKVIVKPDYYF